MTARRLAFNFGYRRVVSILFLPAFCVSGKKSYLTLHDLGVRFHRK